MRATTGHSDDPETIDAINEVISQIEADLDGAEPRAALLFCSVDYEHQEILDRIQARWPGLPLVGATSDGEISSRLGFCDDSILLTVFSGESLRVHTGVGRGLSSGLEAAVAEAMEGMDNIRPAVCLTTFAPSSDAAAVIRAVSGHFEGVRCPILGGLSGDHRDFTEMREFFGGEVLSDAIPLLFIEGDVSVSWGIGSGWFPYGPEMTVTAASGNVVHQIDGRAAVAVFQDQYEDMPSNFLGEFPLACKDETGRWQLRASLFQDESTGSLIFAGTIPEGSTVRFTEVQDEGLLRGSEDALATALDAYEGTEPSLALVFTCAARKWVLGTEAAKEIDLMRAVASDKGYVDLAFAGLYCFGEIAPNDADAPNGFHNETCVSVVIGR